MDFYSLPIIINERREKIINLNYRQEAQTEFEYIVEVHKHAHFIVSEIQADSVLKSFIPQQHDLLIKDCRVECVLNNHTLAIGIYPKKQEAEIVANTTQEVKPPAKPLSYEDLELFKSAPKKQEVKANNEIVQVASTSAVIGVWQNTIEFIKHEYSNGALLIAGFISGNLDSLLQKEFPNLRVAITLHTDDKMYSSTTLVSFAHPEQFLGIALDFGSEASQMATKHYQLTEHHQHMRPEVENLFKNMLSFNKSMGWINKDEHPSYYQEEKNTNFYKSIFFLKENLSGHYANIYKDLFIADIPNNFKMLVNNFNGYQVLTQNKYHQLPNLKITHKYDHLFSNINFDIDVNGYEVNLNLGRMKNKVYNTILRVMAESYLKKEFSLADQNATRKVRFILLVPNIYDFYDIKSTQKILHNIFKSLSENEYKNKLLNWEIITISESDASFLGYINKNDTEIKKNKEYIIIDSGKGTTDLSIIRTGRTNVFDIKTIYRNGFAGAGNLITFAVFETIIHYIRANATNQNEAFKFIKEKILTVLGSNDLELKNIIYEQIERLKFKFTDNTAYAQSQWRDARVGDTTFKNLTEEGRADITSTFKNLLAGIENIGDFYGYIDEACKTIALRAVKNIKLVKKNAKQFDSGGVVLSGRAFLFKPLEKQMRQLIVKELNIADSEIHLLHGNELKDICIKGVFNYSVRLNAEKIGYPIQVIHSSKMEPEITTQIPVAQKPKKSIQNRLLKILFNEQYDWEDIETVIPTTHTNLKYSALENSQILIGGKLYKILGNSIYNQNAGVNTVADLLFTESGYLVRKLENGTVKSIIELSEIIDAEDINMEMVIPSLFPNYMNEDYIQSLNKAIQPAGSVGIANNTDSLAVNTQQNATNLVENAENDGPIYF